MIIALFYIVEIKIKTKVNKFKGVVEIPQSAIFDYDYIKQSIVFDVSKKYGDMPFDNVEIATLTKIN